MLGPCFSYCGDFIDACAGNGGKVAADVSDGVRWMLGGMVCASVGVAGFGVNGKAVGTGPTGLIIFFT